MNENKIGYIPSERNRLLTVILMTSFLGFAVLSTIGAVLYLADRFNNGLN